jgi:hypothetical protein
MFFLSGTGVRLLTAKAGEVSLELPSSANCAHTEPMSTSTTLRVVDGATAAAFRAFAKACFEA